MSAFVVSKSHIDAMLRVALADNPYRSHQRYMCWYIGGHLEWVTPETASDLGQMLIDENVASVCYRYQEEDDSNLPGPLDEYWLEEYEYSHNPLARTPTPEEGLKLISCYEYQSCEHAGWNASCVRLFCQALKDELISRLAGYENAPWEWTESEELQAV